MLNTEGIAELPKLGYLGILFACMGLAGCANKYATKRIVVSENERKNYSFENIRSKLEPLNFQVSQDENWVAIDGVGNHDLEIIPTDSTFTLRFPKNKKMFSENINSIINQEGVRLGYTRKSHSAFHIRNAISPGLGADYLKYKSIYFSDWQQETSMFLMLGEGILLAYSLYNKRLTIAATIFVSNRITWAIMGNKYVSLDNKVLEAGYRVRFRDELLFPKLIK